MASVWTGSIAVHNAFVTAQPYDPIADWYAATRGDQGRDFLAAALALAPPGPVLDLGCGTGRPLGRAVLDAGRALHGVDASVEMLRHFRMNCPEATCEQADLIGYAATGTFALVLCWDALFHLPAGRHAPVIAASAAALLSGGVLLFTAGGVAGKRSGEMQGESFTYHSLDEAGYRAASAAAGLEVLTWTRDQEPADHLVIVGTRFDGACHS